MVECNGLFDYVYFNLKKWMQANKVTYYSADIGVTYRELFKRSCLACIAFYDSNDKKYYMYFNTAYAREINRMIFTSVTVISCDNISTKTPVHEFKFHMDSTEDFDGLIKLMEAYL